MTSVIHAHTYHTHKDTHTHTVLLFWHLRIPDVERSFSHHCFQVNRFSFSVEEQESNLLLCVCNNQVMEPYKDVGSYTSAFDTIL